MVEKNAGMSEARTLEQMLEEGIYFLDGVDAEGESIFRLDPEVAEEKAPDLYWAEQTAMTAAVMRAVDEGFMEIVYDPLTLEATLVITEKGMAL